MTKILEGRLALVTGASRGIGRAVAKVLASAPARRGGKQLPPKEVQALKEEEKLAQTLQMCDTAWLLSLRPRSVPCVCRPRGVECRSVSTCCFVTRNLSTLLVMLPVIILLAVQHTRLSARTLTHFMSAQAPVSALANSLREIRLEASNSEEVQIIVIDDPYRPDFETPALLAQLLLDPLIAGVMRMSGTEFEVMEASEKNKLVLRFDGERFTPVDY